MTRFGQSLLIAVAMSAIVVLPSAAAEPFRVLTYNLWHGFWRTPDKELLVLPSEPKPDRERRHAAQLAELARLRPDVLLAQEVHPLPWRARRLARGLGHRSIHQLVSCGVKFVHLGIPWDIRSGLVITARDDLDLEWMMAPALSGRYGFCSDWLGLQFEESRRALVGRLTLAGDRRLLVITTHLHSSTEGGAARDERRTREAEALIAMIADLRRRDPTLLGVVLGGDFNALAGSEALERIRRAGFVDSAWTQGREFPTYDPWTNEIAAEMTRAGGGDPERSPPRRIDYLFVSSELAPLVRAVERYGFRPATSPKVDSDHFGVLLELDLPPQ